MFASTARYMAGEMPPPFSMVCWNPCYFGRLCQENGTFAEIVWMVSLFVFSANRRNAKYQLRSLPSVNVLSSAFMRHTISSFRAFAVSKTYEIVWRSRGCSFFGARRRRREFFCAARAQRSASWYYQPVRLIESHFTFLAFSRDCSIAFPCVS